MSFLIIESGSTKADWAFVLPEQTVFFQTPGINPTTSDVISMSLEKELTDLLNIVSEVYFYGAGVVKQSNEHIIESFLQSYNAKMIINIESDLTAAIRSSIGEGKGIVCILGTGSHSCVVDDGKVITSIPSLGYLLSDEGSGNHIGKKILKSYFYQDMGEEDRKKFEVMYAVSRPELLEKLYKSKGVSAYLASFTTFLNHCSITLRRKILSDCFEEFISLRIKKYDQYLNFGIYFVGSIAFHFQEELKSALEIHELKAELIIERPMTKLIEYHNNKLYGKRD